jgi:NAD(P)H-nitrite reductase
VTNRAPQFIVRRCVTSTEARAHEDHPIPDRRRRHDRRRGDAGHPRPRRRRLDHTRRLGASPALQAPAADEGPLERERRGDDLARHGRPGVDLVLGRSIVSIDLDAKRATDDAGDEYAWEKLLLATGGTPRKLANADDDVVYFRTLDDFASSARSRTPMRTWSSSAVASSAPSSPPRSPGWARA